MDPCSVSQITFKRKQDLNYIKVGAQNQMCLVFGWPNVFGFWSGSFENQTWLAETVLYIKLVFIH